MAKRKVLKAAQKRALQMENIRFIKDRVSRDSKILGLDPSLKGFGWCVLDGDGSVIDSGTISLRGTEIPHKEYLSNIRGKLLEIVERHQPEVIAFEQVNVSKNFLSAVALAKTHGTMYSVLPACTKLLFPVNVKSVKSAAVKEGARSKTDKSDLADYVSEQYGLTFSDSDQVDAYLVARIARRAVTSAYGFSGSSDKDMMEYRKLNFNYSCDKVEFLTTMTVLEKFNMLKENDGAEYKSVKNRVYKL